MRSPRKIHDVGTREGRDRIVLLLAFLAGVRIPTHPAGRSDKIRSAIPEYPAT